MSEMLGPQPEPPETTEFRQYLADKFNIADPSAQYLVTQFFRYPAIKSLGDLGLLTHWDPIEAARQIMIAEGITDPEQHKGPLRRLYQDLEDPR